MSRVIKIPILGQKSVGKSALTLQFVEGKFNDSYNPTEKNDFKTCNDIDRIILIDTPGQDKLTLSEEIDDIEACVFVYDVNSLGSFITVTNININLLFVKKKPNIMLVGNKIDLNNREVLWDQGNALAVEWRASFCEVSAKDHHIVNNMFHRFISSIQLDHSERCEDKFVTLNNKVDCLTDRIDALTGRIESIVTILSQGQEIPNSVVSVQTPPDTGIVTILSEGQEIPNSVVSVQTPPDTGMPAEGLNTQAPVRRYEPDSIAGPSNEEQDDAPTEKILSPPSKKRKLESKSISIRKVLKTYIDLENNESEPKVEFRLDVEENSIQPIKINYKNIRKAKAIKTIAYQSFKENVPIVNSILQDTAKYFQTIQKDDDST